MLWLLIAPLAVAGPWVSGTDDARSVVLVQGSAGQERAALCADKGESEDRVPGDGVWDCGDPDGEGPYAVILDGTRRVVVQGETDGEFGVDASTGGVQSTRPAGTEGPPNAARPAVLVALDLGPLDSAPVIELRDGSRLEVTCGDDGGFPDLAQNDGVASCGGHVQMGAFTLRIRSEGQRDEAIPASDRALHFLTVTADAVSDSSWALSSKARPGEHVEVPVEAPPEHVEHVEVQPDQRAHVAVQPEDPAGVPHVEVGPDAPPETTALPDTTSPASGPSGGAWWALFGLLLLGGAGLLLTRGGLRVLPRGLAWPKDASVHGPEERELPPDQRDALLQELSTSGPVVYLGPDGPLPAGTPGPVLRATTPDALDLDDAIRRLARRHGLKQLHVVIDPPERLQAPGEIGFTPLQALLRALPPGVRVLLVRPPGPSE